MSNKALFEDSDETESGEDFSASEDDWKPGKDDNVSDEDDDDDDDVDYDIASISKYRKSKIANKKSNTSANRLQTLSLRSKLFRKHNPSSKIVSESTVPSKVADILSSSHFKPSKQMRKTTETQSDSESSDDDGLINPNEIDLNSDFFNFETNNQQNPVKNSAPVFDCNAGMNLSDSSDNEQLSSIVHKINKKSSSEIHDFSSLQNFAKNLETAKAYLENLNCEKLKKSEANADESDINKLLSLGEGTSTNNRKRKLKVRQHSDDSDWENVSGKKLCIH